MAASAFTGDDANARLGVRVEHLSGDEPPNAFLFPRSLLHFHREGGFYPFLPAYPPNFLITQQPNPILESCAGKFFLSAAMGACVRIWLECTCALSCGTHTHCVCARRALQATAWATCLVSCSGATKASRRLCLFQDSASSQKCRGKSRYELHLHAMLLVFIVRVVLWLLLVARTDARCCLAHADGRRVARHGRQDAVLGQQLPRHLVYELRATRVCMCVMCVASASSLTRCLPLRASLAMAPAIFAGLECAVEKARGRHDVGNELVAGCATGAALAAGQGIQVQWLACRHECTRVCATRLTLLLLRVCRLQAQCLGCAGFAAFSYAIHKFTDGRF